MTTARKVDQQTRGAVAAICGDGTESRLFGFYCSVRVSHKVSHIHSTT